MSDDERAAWAPLIIERREQLDMTQEQLAKAAGVAPKTIYNMEAGGVTPQPRTLRRLQAALGLSTDIEVARERIALGQLAYQVKERSAASRIDQSVWRELNGLAVAALQLGDLVVELAPEMHGRVEEYKNILGVMFVETIAAAGLREGAGARGYRDDDFAMAVLKGDGAVIAEDEEVVTAADIPAHGEPPEPGQRH